MRNWESQATCKSKPNKAGGCCSATFFVHLSYVHICLHCSFKCFLENDQEHKQEHCNGTVSVSCLCNIYGGLHIKEIELQAQDNFLLDQ